jgi:ribosomal protein L11 methyltransferase
MNYIELNIAVEPKAPWTEILIAQLAEIEFESFTENNGQLQAYIQEPLMNSEQVDQVINALKEHTDSISYTTKSIQEENWNATWEADFQPVTIEDKLIIRAPFHAPQHGFKEEVIIQPQMSFGTGHHQTTWLLSSLLCEKDFQNLTVLDSGTGTGVLAILALKRGAKNVIGTDIERGAVENAFENFERNNLKDADIRLGDIDCVTERNFDVIIANINKNVLKSHLPHYSQRSKTAGELYLSGFFVSDVTELIAAAEKEGYRHAATYNKDEWAVLKFIKH